jgi:hypothetical protein
VNMNFLKVLRENRSLLQALLIVLFLFVFIWVVIALIFRAEPEELVLPFATSGTGSPTGTVSTSDPLQVSFTPLITRTGTATPIVVSTFTPRTGGPLMTATDNDRLRPTSTFTPRPTNTRRPPPTLTPRPTSTRRPPSPTSVPTEITPPEPTVYP